jgi:hypothetical protein
VRPDTLRRQKNLSSSAHEQRVNAELIDDAKAHLVCGNIGELVHGTVSAVDSGLIRAETSAKHNLEILSLFDLENDRPRGCLPLSVRRRGFQLVGTGRKRRNWYT